MAPGRSTGRDGPREFSKSAERLPIAIVVGADALGAKLFFLATRRRAGLRTGRFGNEVYDFAAFLRRAMTERSEDHRQLLNAMSISAPEIL